LTLLLREVGRFLLGAFAWLGLELAIAAAIGTLGVLLFHMDRTKSVGAGFLGAVVMAALAVRVGAPLAFAPVIGGRPLPTVWSIIGAVVAIGLVGRLQPEPAAAP
jgi:hypothetical protein